MSEMNNGNTIEMGRLTLLILVVMTNSCSMVNFEGTLYESPSEAKQAVAYGLQVTLDTVRPSEDVVPATAKVVIPDLETIRQRGVTIIKGRTLPFIGADDESVLAATAEILEMRLLACIIREHG